MTKKVYTPLHGSMTVSGDKSISHRAVMLGSIALGTTEIDGFLPGADCLSTIGCFRAMGIEINRDGTHVTVTGRGLHGLRKPDQILDCGNSGTTTRLISGILSAQAFDTVLTGDASIRKRPMGRIIRPLTEMGADIRSEHGDGCAPLKIHGQPLRGIRYDSPVASAQVKSAILLAGLYADSDTTVTEPYLSRDHTERMLNEFGASCAVRACKDGERPEITVSPASELHAARISVPGDLSSAAFFIAGALLVPGSDLLIKNVGINPTRSGILDILMAMGANLEILPENTNSAEPTASIRIRSSALHGTEIGGSLIPRSIDELPVIAAVAAAAEGTTVIRDAGELKVKESNRIRVMTEGLRKMGADVSETGDGMVIRGGKPLAGASIDSHKDHRIAMTFSILSLIADGPVTISDPDCVNISAPSFYEDLKKVTAV